MIILGFVQFVIIGAICIFEFKNKSPVVFMWATLLAMFGVTHLYTSFNNHTVYSNKTICTCSIFVICFCLCYVFVRFIILNKRSVVYADLDCILTDSSIDKNQLNTLFLCFLAISVLKLVPFIKSSGGLLNTSWSSGRQYTASLNYFSMNQITSVLYFLLSGVFLYALLLKKKWISISSGLTILIVVLLTRNRVEILPLFVGIISYYVIKSKRIKVKTLFLAIIAGIVVIYAVYAIRVFRHYGTISTFIQQFDLYEFNEKVIDYLSNNNGELGLREVFYFFVENNNDFTNFGKGHTYIRMLLVYLPTKWSLGLKPPDFAQSMGAAIGMVQGGSTHPTLFGEVYANFGPIGAVWGVFWAIYACLFDAICSSQKKQMNQVLLYSLLGVTYAVMGRGSVYNSFVWLVWGGLLLAVFELLGHLRIKKPYR